MIRLLKFLLILPFSVTGLLLWALYKAPSAAWFSSGLKYSDLKEKIRIYNQARKAGIL